VSRKLRLVLAAAAVLVASSLGPTASQAVTAEYFPLPEKRPVSEGIAVDPGGNVWFAAGMIGAETVPPLGRLVPASASPGSSSGMSFFPTPAVGENCCANLIRDVAFDPSNQRIWFVRSTGAIGYGVPSAMVPGTPMGQNAVRVPGGVEVGGIAVTGDGTAWFTERGATSSPNYYGNRVGHTNGALGLAELPDLWHQPGKEESIRYDAEPKGITIDKDGYPWFVEADAGNPGYRLARVVGGEYQEHLLQPCQPVAPCSGSFTGTGPVSVTAAPDGTIWFTNVLKNTFGKFDPLTSTMTQYPLTAVDPQLSGGEPRWIRTAQDGTLWLAEFGFISHPNANAIVRIVPSDPPTTTVYKLGADNAPLSVVPDSNGNVWFLNGGTSTSSIGRLAGVVGAPVVPGAKANPPAGTTTVKVAGSGIARMGEVLARGTDIWAKQICVGPPEDRCSLVFLLDSHEYVSGFPGTSPRLAGTSAKRKTRRVVVGSKTATLAGGKSATVKIGLNAKGKAILKRDGVLRLTFHASQKVKKGKKTVLKPLKTKKLTIRASSK
jgi:streptogramin lyase